MSSITKAAYLGACGLLFVAVSAVAMIPPTGESGTGNRAGLHLADSFDRAAADASPPHRQQSRRGLSLEPELAGFAVP